MWDLYTKKDAQTLFGPHKEAVLDFEWKNSLLVSGDKNGVVAMWVNNKNYLNYILNFLLKIIKDINTSTPVTYIRAHKGAVSKISFFSDLGDNNVIISCGV